MSAFRARWFRRGYRITDEGWRLIGDLHAQLDEHLPGWREMTPRDAYDEMARLGVWPPIREEVP